MLLGLKTILHIIGFKNLKNFLKFIPKYVIIITPLMSSTWGVNVGSKKLIVIAPIVLEKA